MADTTSDIRTLLQRVYEDIWNKGDLAAADEIFERPEGVKR